MIPLAAALVYSAGRKPGRVLLWLVPALLIPAAWPASAMLAGEFDMWMGEVARLSDRSGTGILDNLRNYVPITLVSGQDPDILVHPMILLGAVMRMSADDPALMALGAAGLAFAAVVRNRFLAVWTVPVLLFFGSIGFVRHFHLGMLWIVMCIAAAALISAMYRMPAGGGRWRPAGNLALLAAVTAIAALGLSASAAMVHWNAESATLDALSFVLHSYGGTGIHVIAPGISNSLPSQIYDLPYDRSRDGTLDAQITKTKKIITVTPPGTIDMYRRMLDRHYGDPDSTAVSPAAEWRQRIVGIYDDSVRVAEFHTPARPYGTSAGTTHVMEWSPPEWSLLPAYAPRGRALDLDGSAGITLDGTAGLGADPFSIAFWIKKPNAPGSDSPLMSDSGVIREQDAGLRVWLGSAGRIHLGMTDDASNHIQADSFHSLTDGYWHHVVFTYDGSGSPNGLDVYVDGQIDNHRWGDALLAGSAASDRPLAIVAPGAGAGHARDILLDGVRIYSEDLPADSVSAMHECHRERAAAPAAGEIPPERAPACGDRGALLAHLEWCGPR